MNFIIKIVAGLFIATVFMFVIFFIKKNGIEYFGIGSAPATGNVVPTDVSSTSTQADGSTTQKDDTSAGAKIQNFFSTKIKVNPITPTTVSDTQKALPESAYKKVSVTINGNVFDSQIADTYELQTLGLSYRSGLSKNAGLMFIFDYDDYHSFWMKDMNFAIDIIWIDSDKKITHIEHRLKPETYPETFQSPTYARYVFEIPAGQAESANMKVGDSVIF